MFRKLFNTREELIDWLFDHKSWFVGYSIAPVDKLNDLANWMGIEFLGKMDITGNVEDDGEWAGKEHYKWPEEQIEERLPEQFPAVMVLSIEYHKYDHSYEIAWIYESHFKDNFEDTIYRIETDAN